MTEHIHNDECEHNTDGVENSEHILDMISQGEALFQTIRDNTDSAFELLKDSNEDEDTVDVIKIEAGNILEIEKVATVVFDEFERLKENLFQGGDLTEEKKDLIEKYFDKLNNYEQNSTKIFFNLIKKLN